MRCVIFLDAGPLGMITNPKILPITVEIQRWAIELDRAGNRLVVPSIADFEVRRELVRIGSLQGRAALDAWNGADPGRYLPLADSALRLASELWARARNAGTPTADPKELDADVLIAAQILDYMLPQSDFILATTNIGHLAQFVPADLWTNIHP